MPAPSRFPHFLALCASLVLLLAACSSGPAPQPTSAAALQPPPLRIEEIRQQHALPEQVSHLRIENRYGEINLRSLPPGQLGVVAAVQVYGEDGPEPQISLSVEGERALLSVSYADTRPRWRGRPGRTDLSVFIPTIKQLDVQGADDRIQLKRYGGNVRARTTSGNIMVSASGELDLASDSGEIRAILIDPGRGSRHRIEGRALVEVLFPPTVPLRLDARAERLLDVDAAMGWPAPVDGRRLSSPAGTDADAGLLEIRGDEIFLRPFHALR